MSQEYTNIGFKGQYGDETLLLKKHENIISFIISKIYIIIIYIAFSGVIYFIVDYFLENQVIGIIGSISVSLIGILYLNFQFRHTWMIVTDKRCGLKITRLQYF